MGDKIYCYPPTYTVLRNLANLRDQDDLDRFERNAVRVRASERLPAGEFDLHHLQAIHRHLFQDVYAWAGATRQVETPKAEISSSPAGSSKRAWQTSISGWSRGISCRTDHQTPSPKPQARSWET